MIPHHFYGEVRGGLPGDMVSVYGDRDDLALKRTTAFDYQGLTVYVSEVDGDRADTEVIEGAYPGEVLRFYVRTTPAGVWQAGWSSGASTEFHLTIGGNETPTLTDTPLPTPQLLLVIEPQERPAGGSETSGRVRLTIQVGSDSVSFSIDLERALVIVRAILEGG